MLFIQSYYLFSYSVIQLFINETKGMFSVYFTTNIISLKNIFILTHVGMSCGSVSDGLA